MAKRRDNSGDGVSLFPFMSILACLIGILTLMISVSMQVKQMQDVGATDEEKALAAENRDLTKQAKTLQASIAKLEKDLERDKSTSGQLAKLEDRKAILEKQLAAVGDPQKIDAELRKANPILRDEIAAIIKEREAMAQRNKELAAEVAARKNPPKKTESVEIRPAAAGVRMAARLFFVECNSTGIVLLSEKGAPQTINRDAITSSPAFAAFLDEVKSTRDSMILFLIRKSGAESYNWAAGLAESKYEVLTGKLPLPNDGQIDLSRFQKK